MYDLHTHKDFALYRLLWSLHACTELPLYTCACFAINCFAKIWDKYQIPHRAALLSLSTKYISKAVADEKTLNWLCVLVRFFRSTLAFLTKLIASASADDGTWHVGCWGVVTDFCGGHSLHWWWNQSAALVVSSCGIGLHKVSAGSHKPTTAAQLYQRNWWAQLFITVMLNRCENA